MKISLQDNKKDEDNENRDNRHRPDIYVGVLCVCRSLMLADSAMASLYKNLVLQRFR